jgi:calcium channel MID1
VTVIPLDEGYANATLSTNGDLFIGISAPNNTRYSGIYNYEIAASIDAPFHNVDTTTPYLFFVDGDSGAALLQTNDTTQADPDDDIYRQWMQLNPPPFTMFAHNMDDYGIFGLQKSYCGLSKNAQISKSSNNVQVEMTNRGINHKPKEQFYVKNLNASSTYYGFLAMEGNSTNSGSGVVGGGGKVWKPMNFTTKSGTYILCF